MMPPFSIQMSPTTPSPRPLAGSWIVPPTRTRRAAAVMNGLHAKVRGGRRGNCRNACRGSAATRTMAMCSARRSSARLHVGREVADGDHAIHLATLDQLPGRGLGGEEAAAATIRRRAIAPAAAEPPGAPRPRLPA